MARITSIITYRDILNSGKIGKQQFTVLNAMREGVLYSRREITRLTGLETNASTARINELVALGALIEGAPRKCPITGRTIIPVELNTGNKQASLFS